MADKSWLGDSVTETALHVLPQIVEQVRLQTRHAIDHGYSTVDLTKSEFGDFASQEVSDVAALEIMKSLRKMLADEGLKDLLLPSIRVDFGFSQSKTLKNQRWKQHGPAVIYLLRPDLLEKRYTGHYVKITLTALPLDDQGYVVHKYLYFWKSFSEMEDGSPFSRNLMFEIESSSSFS